MIRPIRLCAALFAMLPGVAAASPSKPEHLPLETKLQFDRTPRPGEPVQVTFDVAATQNVHGLSIELQVMTPAVRSADWLDGLTSEPRVVEPPAPWKGDLAAGAHATIKAKLVLPETGVYHLHGVVWGKGVTVGAGGSGDALGYYDTTADLWARVGVDRTVVANGESIMWTRQWNSTVSTVHGDDVEGPPVALSLAFEKLPTIAAEGMLLVGLRASEDVPAFALDLEMPSAGLSVSSVETPRTARAAEPVAVEPGDAVFDVRWKGGLEKGETTTLRVPVKALKVGWDVLRLYASGTRAGDAPGWATHAEMVMIVDEVVSAARERRLAKPPPK